MSKKITRYLSVILAVSILFSGVSLQITTAYAAEADSTVVTDAEPIVSTDSELIDYTQYTTAHGITNKATANIELPIATYAADGADVTVEENVLNWNKGDGTVTWTFDVAQTAVYNLKILWESVQSGINPEFAVLIDGKCPFDEAENIRLSRLWKNADEKPRLPGQDPQRTVPDRKSAARLPGTAVHCIPAEFPTKQDYRADPLKCGFSAPEFCRIH